MIKGKGFDKLIRDLRKIDPREIIEQELVKIGNEILRDALDNVPVDTGELKESAAIETSWEDDTITVTVFFSALYAAYVEFGTGDFVSVPDGLEDYALTFKGSRKGFSRPQPYLFPAYFKVLPQIVKRLDDAFKSQQIFT